MSFDLGLLQQTIRSTGQQELLPRFSQVTSSFKSDGSIVTEADLVAQSKLIASLEDLYPGSVVLGEEMSKSEQERLLLSERPLWCLDPIDGTSNFAAGIPYFAISVALIEKGKVVMGVVYDPVRDEMFHAGLSSAAMLNGKPIEDIRSVTVPNSLNQSIALVDFKRLDSALSTRMVSEPPYKSQRSFGSVALDWCWLAAARVHVYLHGRSNIWDYSAGQFIFQQSGGRSCTLDGNPIFDASLNARSCVGAVNKPLFDEWTSFLAIHQITQKEGEA